MSRVAVSGRVARVENGRNMVLNSQNYANSSWTKVGCSVGALTTAPDGTNTAVHITEDVSVGSHNVGTLFGSAQVSTQRTVMVGSFFAKAAERTLFEIISLWRTPTVQLAGFFDLANGVVVQSSAGTIATIERDPTWFAGWYRCSMYTSKASKQIELQGIINSAASVQSYAGDGVSGIYLWGAQYGEGSYTPTTTVQIPGATRTRQMGRVAASGRVAV